MKNNRADNLYLGSGTTPVLTQDRPAVIADNDQPYFNVLFIEQDSGQIVSKVPTNFPLTQCGIVVKNESSVICVNNAGCGTFLNVHLNGNIPQPGIALLHVTEGVKWTNNEIISTCLPLHCVLIPPHRGVLY